MYRLGIDLGGTNIVAGVVDENYEIIAKASCKTNVPRPESEICDSMADVALKAIEKAKLTIDDIESIGIGVPGAVNPKTGVIEYSANLFFHNWQVVKMMEERLNTKICVENDANAAALGEYLAGSAKGAKNAIAITLGTGIGGGIIINGKIYSGSNYAGAELGHMVIVKDGTGMCGGCRVTVDGKIKYACVDGPDFDGQKVDFDELMRRNSTYKEQEKAHLCRLTGGVR